MQWLEPALSNRDDLTPDALTVERELGRGSLSFARARGVLERLWAELRDHSEVVLKRQLWDGLLREAYGTEVGNDALFLQHTYLTIVAKTIAARVLDLPADNAEAILSGRALDEIGIQGAVESDFFDWILEIGEGRDLTLRIARQTARFSLREVEVDVLKALYESLIDPEQRHDLGEYYTPDWLAAKIVAHALTEPASQRMLDPACGSGTFLFHTIKKAGGGRSRGHERRAGGRDVRRTGTGSRCAPGCRNHCSCYLAAGARPGNIGQATRNIRPGLSWRCDAVEFARSW